MQSHAGFPAMPPNEKRQDGCWKLEVKQLQPRTPVKERRNLPTSRCSCRRARSEKPSPGVEPAKWHVIKVVCTHCRTQGNTRAHGCELHTTCRGTTLLENVVSNGAFCWGMCVKLGRCNAPRNRTKERKQEMSGELAAGRTHGHLRRGQSLRCGAAPPGCQPGAPGTRRWA